MTFPQNPSKSKKLTFVNILRLGISEAIFTPFQKKRVGNEKKTKPLYAMGVYVANFTMRIVSASENQFFVLPAKECCSGSVPTTSLFSKYQHLVQV